MKTVETFTSRWGLLLSVIGIAVGTGNIWRFPRIAASNGGGSFLIPWLLFLFLWSLPLIITEFAIGKRTRRGTAGAFAQMMGSNFTWMGLFVGFVTTAIMFYYSVVAGWCLRYFLVASSGQLLGVENHLGYWNEFVASGWKPILFHVLALSLGAWIIGRGVVFGIEKTNRIIVPCLLGLLVISALRAVTLPGAWAGIAFLFTPDLNHLLDYRVWLQALTQNAWDTGAGWGLILTYAAYMRKRDEITLNAALIGFGNNSVSLLAGITVFATVFALQPFQAQELIQMAGPANTGLTFVWIPQLFAQMPGGHLFASFFFLALTLAALSSLISMLELATRILMDFGLSRRVGLSWVYASALILGIPSAMNNDIFLNQDWTWGVALMVSGLFMALAVIKHGTDRFREESINSAQDIPVGSWYNFAIRFLIPMQVFVLIVWWFGQVMVADPDNWWNPFRVESVGTCLLQWGSVILVLLLFNRTLSRKIHLP